MLSWICFSSSYFLHYPLLHPLSFLRSFSLWQPEQPSLVIERSVSMGRLNTRDLDADHQIKNSLDRSRLKRRAHTVDQDRPPHPAPRIFLSSVSEDRGVVVSPAPVRAHGPARTPCWTRARRPAAPRTPGTLGTLGTRR